MSDSKSVDDDDPHLSATARIIRIVRGTAMQSFTDDDEPARKRMLTRTTIGTRLPTDGLRSALRRHLLLTKRVPTADEAKSMALKERPSTDIADTDESVAAVADQLIDEGNGLIELAGNKSLPGFAWQVGEDDRRFMLFEIAAMRILPLACGNCGIETTGRCSGCSMVHYCGVACQTAHRKVHAARCAIDGSAERRSSRAERMDRMVAAFRPIVLTQSMPTTKKKSAVRCSRVVIK